MAGKSLFPTVAKYSDLLISGSALVAQYSVVSETYVVSTWYGNHINVVWEKYSVWERKQTHSSHLHLKKIPPQAKLRTSKHAKPLDVTTEAAILLYNGSLHVAQSQRYKTCTKRESKP